jgi:hypothetical protein
LSSQETDARTTRTETFASIDCDPALSGRTVVVLSDSHFRASRCASELIRPFCALQFTAFR